MTAYGHSRVRLPARSVAVMLDRNEPTVPVNAALCVGSDLGPDVSSEIVAATDAPSWPSSNVGGVPHVTVGGVASRLTVADALVVPPSDVAEHANVVRAVSLATVAGSQPDREVTVDSASADAPVDGDVGYVPAVR